MQNVRLRMVLVGLVLGVVIAIVVASQGGCGTSHHRRHAAAPIVSDRAGGR